MAVTENGDSAINFPEWTDYQKKNGLDPLGMQNSSITLYQSFLPGISNVTLRMRYYGLYAWLCRTYSQKIGHTDPERWKRFLRRAEALYALVAYHHGNESGVAGIKWAQKELEKSGIVSVDFAAAADPDRDDGPKYLQQAWGAYGAAYGSQLFAVGIFSDAQDHTLPVPSEATGQHLAEVFDDMLGDLSTLLFATINRGTVTLEELDRLAPVLPSEIGMTSEERALYQKILLPPHNPSDAAAHSRRLSVLLILNVAGLLAHDPNADEVRWILYAGQDQDGHPLERGAPELEAQRQRWWVYHANDLCHIALETLLKFTLDMLGNNYPAGIALIQFLPVVVDRLLAEADQAPETWQEFLDSITLAANAYGADDMYTDWALCQDIMRSAGRSDDSVCAPAVAWKAVRLLAILHHRVRDEDHPVADELGAFTSEAFQTLLTESRFLDLHKDEPFADTLARIVEQRVIRRHLWVASRKLQHNHYTFLIDADEGRIRLRKKDGPVFTNPRLGTTITFLNDIHLISGQGLTDYGAEAARAK